MLINFTVIIFELMMTIRKQRLLIPIRVMIIFDIHGLVSLIFQQPLVIYGIFMMTITAVSLKLLVMIWVIMMTFLVIRSAFLKQCETWEQPTSVLTIVVLRAVLAAMSKIR